MFGLWRSSLLSLHPGRRRGLVGARITLHPADGGLGLRTGPALLAIIVGTISGSLLLAAVAAAAHQTALPSMAMLRRVIGRQGSYAATILNIVQLVGWTAFEFWAMSEFASRVSDQVFGFKARGMWLVVVCEPGDARRLAETVLMRTSTLGVRIREERRIELPRRSLDVDTEYGPIRIKITILHGENTKAMPEFESVAAAAARTGAALSVVSAAALRALEKLPSSC